MIVIVLVEYAYEHNIIQKNSKVSKMTCTHISLNPAEFIQFAYE